MRVLELAEFGSPHPGSFVPVLGDVLEAAGERGWAAELLLGASARGMPWVDELRAKGLGVRLAPRGSDRRLARWLRGVLDEHDGPTAMHSHFTGFDVPAVLAAHRRPGAGVFWHDHSVLSPSPLIVARNVLKYGVLGRGVDLVFCPSSDLAVQIRRRGMSADRIAVVHNGIDASRYRPASEERQRAARRNLGLPAQAPVILTFTWNWRVKGGDLFLATLKSLTEAGVEATGLCAGSRTEAEASAARLGVAGRLRAFEEVPDVRELFAAASLFFTASRGDTSPYAVQEALASGLPVVASDLPGHRLIGEGLAACSIVPNEVGALTAAVKAQLANPDREEAAKQARSRIEAEFSQRRWSTSILDALERTLLA